MPEFLTTCSVATLETVDLKRPANLANGHGIPDVARMELDTE